MKYKFSYFPIHLFMSHHYIGENFTKKKEKYSDTVSRQEMMNQIKCKLPYHYRVTYKWIVLWIL